MGAPPRKVGEWRALNDSPPVQVCLNNFFKASFRGYNDNGSIQYQGSGNGVSLKSRTRLERHLIKRNIISESDRLLGVLTEESQGESVNQVMEKVKSGAAKVELDKEMFV